MSNQNKVKMDSQRTFNRQLQNNDTENRIPKLEYIDNNKKDETKEDKNKMAFDINSYCIKKPKYVLYNNISYKEDLKRRSVRRELTIYNYCILSVIFSFILGLVIGVALMSSKQRVNITNNKLVKNMNITNGKTRNLNSLKQDNYADFNDKALNNRFDTVSFTGADPNKYKKDIYPQGLTEDMKDILKDNKKSDHKHTLAHLKNTSNHLPNQYTVLFDNIYWGPGVEDHMPQGYGGSSAEIWEKYVDQSEVIKMEAGCGRMQNRLVTFRDGIQACVRYRQNTDQIQGEIFSFYVGNLLNLTNLAPSVVKVVDVKDMLWRNVAAGVASAQWNTNHAVVLTQYIPSLESATIPDIFKPATRHLNKNDVLAMSLKENDTADVSKEILLEKLKKKNLKTNKLAHENFDHIDMKLNRKVVDSFVELAQWSDLIIFDYLTANLDRIVNNLFNYQWNINIMDGPAHNLARKMDSGLLMFLDNESGLLHGYRLLKKYNVYHSLMLDNLCVFRKRTVDSLRTVYESSVGVKLSDMFHKKNSAVIRDILPPLPEKNAKILQERIGKVLSQVDKCAETFR